MVVIIRATNAPFARAKAGGIMRAIEATQTVVRQKWHDMGGQVYRSLPGRLAKIPKPTCGNIGAGLQHTARKKPSVVTKELRYPQEAAS